MSRCYVGSARCGRPLAGTTFGLHAMGVRFLCCVQRDRSTGTAGAACSAWADR